jgi:hypothetical protein
MSFSAADQDANTAPRPVREIHDCTAGDPAEASDHRSQRRRLQPDPPSRGMLYFNQHCGSGGALASCRSKDNVIDPPDNSDYFEDALPGCPSNAP